MKVEVINKAPNKSKPPFESGDLITIKNDSNRVILLFINNTTQIVLKHYMYDIGEVSSWAPFHESWELFDGEVTISNG